VLRATPQIKEVFLKLRAGSHNVSVAIERFTADERARLRAAGKAAAQTLTHVGARLRPGIATSEIDRWVRQHTRELGGTPSQLGYHGFPAAVCTSRNHVVCHGVPSPKDVLQEGDIVNVDVTTCLNGFHGDTSITFAIGEVSAEARHVTEAAERCLWAGIHAVRPDARLGDLGHAIAELAQREGCTVVTDYGGHGIGRRMHADPHVSHVGKPGEGLRLKAGMAFTIEPMLCLGSNALRTLDDGWTVVTVDGRLSAQFEHTVLVTETGCEVMTLL
jgi:methionyl aminopeptidase